MNSRGERSDTIDASAGNRFRFTGRGFGGDFEVVWVQVWELAADLEAVPVLRISDEVQGPVLDDGHVSGAVVGPEPGEVVVEDDVEYPVETVLDVPVCADRLGEAAGIKRG